MLDLNFPLNWLLWLHYMMKHFIILLYVSRGMIKYYRMDIRSQVMSTDIRS
jgi:hypothetical protein